MGLQRAVKLGAGAGVVEGDEPATMPLDGAANVAGKLQFVWGDEMQGFKGNLTERDDAARRDKLDGLAQVRRTIVDFPRRRGRVASALVTWIAEDSVGDENLFACQRGGLQKRREIATVWSCKSGMPLRSPPRRPGASAMKSA